MTRKNTLVLRPLLADARERTELWFQQREQCWVCIHCEASGPSLQCIKAYPAFERNCMTVREAGGICGPDAKLFELNEDAV